MSTKHGCYRRHHFDGDPLRFEVVADFVGQNYGDQFKKIADVAGGQGMLARILTKRYNFKVDVIDPRGHTIVGVTSRAEEYNAEMSDYYDLVIGLHPDGALKEVVLSALVRPILVVPCCNFWDKTKKLGRNALIDEIESFLDKHQIKHKRVAFNFESSKNIGIITEHRLEI